MRDQATEELWAAIAPQLPPRKPSPKGGRPPVSDRRAFEGILYVLREGIRWQSLPIEKGWGSGSTCWRRFAAWTKAGVWDQAHDHLLAALGQEGLLNLERSLVDSAASRAQKGGYTPDPIPWIGPNAASSGMW